MTFSTPNPSSLPFCIHNGNQHYRQAMGRYSPRPDPNPILCNEKGQSLLFQIKGLFKS